MADYRLLDVTTKKEKLKNRWRYDELKRVQVYLPKSMIAWLDDAADELRITRSEVLRRCVDTFGDSVK